MPAAVVLDSSCAGLTRASIEKSASFKGMDCRIKPGDDGGWVGVNGRRYTPIVPDSSCAGTSPPCDALYPTMTAGGLAQAAPGVRRSPATALLWSPAGRGR